MSHIITKEKCHIYVSLLLLGFNSKRRWLNEENIYLYGGRVEKSRGIEQCNFRQFKP
ncbi:MAG: hypothetical protein RMI01_00870 [Thermodesulfovibrio sp.]|nr:hypothetical protein [Thermodesulfovibrio sp.]